MIEIRQTLQPYLKNLHPRVYFQRAPETAQVPYLTYDFPNVLNQGEGQHLLTLDIDGWDNRPDTAELENLMAVVEGGLDKHVLVGDKIAIAFYLENKIPLTEDDQKIHRRKYTFQGRIFKRSD